MSEQTQRYELVDTGGAYSPWREMKKKDNFDKYETPGDYDYWCNAEDVVKLERELAEAREGLRKIRSLEERAIATGCGHNAMTFSICNAYIDGKAALGKEASDD